MLMAVGTFFSFFKKKSLKKIPQWPALYPPPPSHNGTAIKKNNDFFAASLSQSIASRAASVTTSLREIEHLDIGRGGARGDPGPCYPSLFLMGTTPPPPRGFNPAAEKP